VKHVAVPAGASSDLALCWLSFVGSGEGGPGHCAKGRTWPDRPIDGPSVMTLRGLTMAPYTPRSGRMAVVEKTLEAAVEQLQRDPDHPVLARVGALTVEIRAVHRTGASGSAADVFAGIGPWSGETTEEVMAILSDARSRGGSRSIGDR
jgi:hypothetical protein